MIIDKFIELFGFEKKGQKKIAYNDDFVLLNEKGEHRLKHFTGHISFDEFTECDVEDATLDFYIGNPSYIDWTVPCHAPLSRGVNSIVWHDGTVVSGNLKCREFENGNFNGDTLVIVKNTMNGTFNGKELHELLPF